MDLRYPAPLRPGDLIAVTAPSAGVQEPLRARLDFAVEHLEAAGYRVRLGQCLDGASVTSAPAVDRARELTALLTDPDVRAVVPPWGGELAVEVLPHLDWDALATADPTWLVGFSDIDTLLLPLTTRTATATLHGQNLMDTPYPVPAPLRSWLDVVSREPGTSVEQGPSSAHRRSGHDDWATDPRAATPTFDAPGTWRLLDPGAGPVHARGRLIGGCLETVSVLAGTPYGDLRAFADRHAPEGLLLHVEASEATALDAARHLWRLRLAGWFDDARAVLVGRTTAPDSGAFTHDDAVRSVLGDLPVPVVLDVDCGHVPPHLALVNGALTELRVGPDGAALEQWLVP